VKLRFSAGLTMPQAAEALGLSLAAAERHWTLVQTGETLNPITQL
jgi:hypothetical protein